MRGSTKLWIASGLIVVGGILFFGALALLDFDVLKLSEDIYETNRYEIVEPYRDIVIDADTAEIVFTPSDTEKTSVVCVEQDNMRHTVAVRDGALVIEMVDSRKWYEHIGIHFDSPRITVCMPEGEHGVLSIESQTGAVNIPNEFQFERMDISLTTGAVKNYASASGDMRIRTTTGAITLESVRADAVSLSVSTGVITVSDVTCGGNMRFDVTTGKTQADSVRCKTLVSDGDTGDIILKNVIAQDMFALERSTGDVLFEACDAQDIFVETDTGDVSGTLLSGKNFEVETDTGRVDVPKTDRGGRCEISTDTGDIRIKVQ